MTRHNPRQFGRKPKPPALDQRIARFAAICCFILAAVAGGAVFGVDSDGLRVLLGVIAFGSLALAIAAAEEA